MIKMRIKTNQPTPTRCFLREDCRSLRLSHGLCQSSWRQASLCSSVVVIRSFRLMHQTWKGLQHVSPRKQRVFSSWWRLSRLMEVHHMFKTIKEVVHWAIRSIRAPGSEVKRHSQRIPMTILPETRMTRGPHLEPRRSQKKKFFLASNRPLKSLLRAHLKQTNQSKAPLVSQEVLL